LLVGHTDTMQELYEAKFGAGSFSRISHCPDDCRPHELEDLQGYLKAGRQDLDIRLKMLLDIPKQLP
jgi:hypothetical protein